MSGSTELEVMEMGRIDDPAEAPAAPAEPERPVNPRDAIMKAIAEKYDEKVRGGEIAYGEQLLDDARRRAGVEEPAPEERAEGSQGQALADAAPAESTATPAPAPVAAPPPQPEQPQLVAVPINGQQLYVTQEQLLHLAKMGAVANLALQQAPQAPVAPPPVAPEAAPAPASPLTREQAVQVARRLSYGSEEDQAAAVQELAAQLVRQPSIDPGAVAQQATNAALAQIRFESDLNTVGKEFPDIFEDRYRTLAAAGCLGDIRQRDAMLGQQRSPLEQYREAAQMVRASFAPPSSQPGVNSPASQAALAVEVQPQRLDRKRAAPRHPVAVSRAAPIGEPEARYATPSEVVDAYRKSRGQMPMR